MPKLVLKTILNTFLGIFAGLVLVWGVISLAFPKCFVEITYNMGWEKVSAWYAASSYVRTRDLDDLATATEMSVYAKNYKQVVKYGEIFIRMDGFEEYCEVEDATSNAAQDNTSYKQWIYGQIAVSRYMLGDRTKAVETAFAAEFEVFGHNNAVALLVYTVADAEDADTCLLIRQQLLQMDIEEDAFYDTIMFFLNSVIEGE